MGSEMRCSGRVFAGTVRGHRCTRRAVNFESGKGWCKQHAPSVTKDEIAALIALRDAVGKYVEHFDDREVVGTWSEVVEGYKKAKEARDAK